jgi:hypothetical protein
MSITVCLSASTIGYPEGGGHLWVYLNWALGLRAQGCRVIWLESVQRKSRSELGEQIAALQLRLARYGLGDCLALCSSTDEPLPEGFAPGSMGLEAAADADLLLNLRYGTHPDVVARFRRRALVDIDPGLLQLWLAAGKIELPIHDVYFSTGETVGRADARFPSAGIAWQYTPPCVDLDAWPATGSADDAPLTTVSHWVMGEWMLDGDEVYSNDKRTGFVPYLDLPKRTERPLELSLCLSPDDDDERAMLLARGWRVRDSRDSAGTPWDYQRYVQGSRGEFSCVKPSCVRLQNAWISDRTLCYLASGKPALVEHTGPSRILPDAEGVLRFRDVDEAVRLIDAVETDYDRHCRAARALAEHWFDAKKVVGSVLERALS